MMSRGDLKRKMNFSKCFHNLLSKNHQFFFVQRLNFNKKTVLILLLLLLPLLIVFANYCQVNVCIILWTVCVEKSC